MQVLLADRSAHGSFSPRHAESMEFFTSGSCGFTPRGMSLTWFRKKVRMGNWWVGFIKLIGGKTAFCSAAPTIWNSLSLSLYLIDSQSDFKSQLKTPPFPLTSVFLLLFISEATLLVPVKQLRDGVCMTDRIQRLNPLTFTY